MSKLSGGPSANGPVRAVGSVGQARAAGGPRRESLLRFDEADDPRQGIDLYEAVVLQETGGLTDGGWLDRLEAIVRLKARLAALEAETVAGFDEVLKGVSADLGHRRPQWGDREATAGERRWVAGDLRSVADEVALILEMHRGHATTRIHTSCELVHNFPATLHALTEGWLTERAAFTIVRELSVLEELDDIRAAEAAMLDWARTHPLVEIKKACRKEVALRSPAAMDAAYRRAHEERSVRMYTDDLGRADLVHNQDALEAAAVMTSLSRAAAHRRRHGDNRTLDQLRADIAMERLLPRRRRSGRGAVMRDSSVGEAAGGFGPRAGDCERADGVVREPGEEMRCGPDDGHEPAGSATYASADEARCESADGSEHAPNSGDWEPADGGYEPVDDSGHELADRIDCGAADGVECEMGGEVGGEPIEAQSTVVIHATGAEMLALITGEVATGGEADHHGPIPQTVLRKHVTDALARSLLANVSAASSDLRRPQKRHPGAADDDASTAVEAARRASATPGTAFAAGSLTDGAFAASGGSRIELQLTDQPPPSDPNRYLPSAALDRYVRLRDRTCQFPGCNRPAEFTDLDHRIAFAAGGRTTAANLWCLCRHHHRLKHEGGWQVRSNPDGTHTWISPTGRQYPGGAVVHKRLSPRRKRPGDGHLLW